MLIQCIFDFKILFHDKTLYQNVQSQSPKIEYFIHACLYRCGNVAGSLEVPSWNPADLTLLMLQGCIVTMSAPDVNWQVKLNLIQNQLVGTLHTNKI